MMGLKIKYMKTFFTLFFSIFIFSSFTIQSQGIENVVSAFKVGNANKVAIHFDNTIEITLPQKSSSYSKSQAEMILKDFFNINSVKDFVVIHKGENAGSEYCIGTLLTKNANYRTTIFMKHKGSAQVIQEIRLELR